MLPIILDAKQKHLWQRLGRHGISDSRNPVISDCTVLVTGHRHLQVRLTGWYHCQGQSRSRESDTLLLPRSLYILWAPYFFDSSVGMVTVLAAVDCVWNVMAQPQKPDFVFRRKGLVHLNRQGRQFSRLLTAEVCASAVVMLDTPCSEVVWRALATESIRQFPLHFPSRASPCAITFQLDATTDASELNICGSVHHA